MSDDPLDWKIQTLWGQLVELGSAIPAALAAGVTHLVTASERQRALC